MNSAPPNHRDSGFTLIELLVVIVIIGILAALLFPVVSRMKVAAKKTACLNNLRQCSIAFNSYLAEHDGVYPPNTAGVTDPVTGSSSGNRWVNHVAPYAGGDAAKGWRVEIFHCSLTPKEKYQAVASGSSFGAYGYNQNFINSSASEPRVRAVRITNPSKVILLADTNYNADVASSCVSRNNPCPAAPNGAAANHRPDQTPANGPDGECNYLFTDGHAETLLKWPKTATFDPFLPY